MNKNFLRILSAVIVGILIVAVMASCGKVEKPNDVQDPSVQSPTQNTPAATEPTAKPEDESTAPETEIVPEPETTPATSQTEPTTEPTQTEPVTEPVTEPSAEPEDLTVDREKIVETATAQLGVPFCQGGDSPEEGFDSTGFTYYCVNQAGIEFPRRLSDQLESGELIPYSELKPGDIAYFAAEEGGEASFCGVYAGGGLIIYSPVPDDFVKTANITTNYWTTHFVTGLRVSNPQ